MNRSLTFVLLSSLALGAAALGALPACTANLEEGCLGGVCRSGTPAESPSGGGGSGGAGMGGAGGGGLDCSGFATTGQFPCEVFDVLVARCHACHIDPPLNGAPFPLLQFEKTREVLVGKAIWQRMQTAIETGFMPLGQPDLMGSELQIMQDWFAQCAPPVPDGMGCEMP